MYVECILHGNGFKIPDETAGNKTLYVKNDTGYNNVRIGIKESNGERWFVLGEISVDGNTLIKAINNAMND